MPNQLWNLSTREFVDMYEAHVQQVNEDVDMEMQKTSWATALLINASGNMKKRITPEMLYVPLDKQDTKKNNRNKDYVDKQKKDLKRKFNI